METKYCICLITTDSYEVAHKIAKEIVEQRLAACVNILQDIKSIYRWQDKIETSSELLLIIKTKLILAKDVIKFVKDRHNYSVPEIVFIPIIEGNEEYLDWVGANTLFTTNISKEREEKQ